MSTQPTTAGPDRPRRRSVRPGRPGSSAAVAAAVAVTAAAVTGLVVRASTAHPADAPLPVTVTLVAHHSRWSRSTIHARVGQTVRFVVRNDDPIDHELIIGDDRVQAAHERGTDAHHEGRPGQLSVPAGATASTSFRFTQPGHLTFACHLPGHFTYGMHGAIVVGA